MTAPAPVDVFNPDAVKLGKKPGKVVDRRTIMAGSVLQPDEVRAPLRHRVGGQLSWVPMFANDVLGDCTQASKAHAVLTMERSSGQRDLALTDADVIRAYSEVGGYVPGRPDTDNGAYELDSMNHWRQVGIGLERDGTSHKIHAFVQVDHTNPAEVTLAHLVFGGLKVCAGLPQSAADQMQAGQPWDLASGTRARFGSWGGHCFAGDTRIALLDGSEVALSELAARGGDHWVYSIDERGHVAPGRGRQARLTGRDRDTVNVSLDNGQTVACTPEHRWMLRDGTYREARYLQAGDSLMPLYRRYPERGEPGYEPEMTGYEQVQVPASGRWLFTHRIVGRTIGAYRRGMVVHHADFNKLNNAPDNLVLLSWDAHQQLHADLANPEALAGYARSAKGRDRSRELMTALWADAAWRSRMLSTLQERAAAGRAAAVASGGLGFARPTGPDAHRRGRQTRIANMDARSPDPAVLQDMVSSLPLQQVWETCGVSRDVLIRWMERHGITRPPMGHWNTRDHSTRWNEGERAVRNHKVTGVTPGRRRDVYDLTVDHFHNFALAAGVFVHNSMYSHAYDRDLRVMPDQRYRLSGLDGLAVWTWGREQWMTWAWWASYVDEVYAVVSEDFYRKSGRTPQGFDADRLQQILARL